MEKRQSSSKRIRFLVGLMLCCSENVSRAKTLSKQKRHCSSKKAFCKRKWHSSSKKAFFDFKSILQSNRHFEIRTIWPNNFSKSEMSRIVWCTFWPSFALTGTMFEVQSEVRSLHSQMHRVFLVSKKPVNDPVPKFKCLHITVDCMA